LLDVHAGLLEWELIEVEEGKKDSDFQLHHPLYGEAIQLLGCMAYPHHS
jgi:hypothetical protein